MRRTALLATVVALALFPRLALADDGDAARAPVTSLPLGQQVVMILTVVTPAGATVEIDPAAPAWSGVEVIRLGKTRVTTVGSRSTHRIEVTVAPFLPGAGVFAPTVNVIEGGSATPRQLPEVSWTVTSSLAEGAPLELTKLPPPSSIAGAESPLLKPAIGIGITLGLALAALVLFVLGRALAGRLRTVPAIEVAGLPAMDLSSAEAQLEGDPVSAYRSLAASVRTAVGQRYGFPAQALSTNEVQRRMEGEGIDKWHARLVSRLLEECDAVVYAGYRPALERRRTDLTTAREIVEGTV